MQQSIENVPRSHQHLRAMSCEGKVGSMVRGVTVGGFATGFGAAAMAESMTIPLDTLKVRRQLDPLQLRYKGSIHTIRTILAEEGMSTG